MIIKEDLTQMKAIGERIVRFTISTGAIDRDGDTISPSGWDFTTFRQNPTGLWAHDEFIDVWSAILEQRGLRSRLCGGET